MCLDYLSLYIYVCQFSNNIYHLHPAQVQVKLKMNAKFPHSNHPYLWLHCPLLPLVITREFIPIYSSVFRSGYPSLFCLPHALLKQGQSDRYA